MWLRGGVDPNACLQTRTDRAFYDPQFHPPPPPINSGFLFAHTSSPPARLTAMSKFTPQSSDATSIATIRTLAADVVGKANSGHPGQSASSTDGACGGAFENI